MNTELLEALDILEKEKNISKDVMLEAIENSLLSACKNHFGTSDNIKIVMDRNRCDYSVYAEREVVEEVFDQYFEKEKDIVTGIVQRYIGKNISVNLGKADAILTENEQVKGEHFEPTERIKLYIVEVKNTPKGPKILVSRTHPELVKRLFESEVAEVKDGTVEIKSIAREAGSRTKMAVWSNDPNVDPVGACVGMNGARVNAVVKELSLIHISEPRD